MNLLFALFACSSGNIELPFIDTARPLEETAPPQETGEEDEDEIEQVPGVKDPIEQLFAGETVPVFELELSEAAIAALAQAPDTYVEGALTFGDVRLDRVGVRLKGENSFLPISQKAAFKIKLDEYVEDQELYGLRSLTFNNLVSDATYLHEWMSYRHFRLLDLPAARTGHAWIHLNGEPYSLYAFIETIDKRFLKRWFDEADGPMWELADVDFQVGYLDSFQLEEGEDDRALLVNLANALALPGEKAIVAAEPYLNWSKFLDFWAAEIIVGQFDSYPYSSPGDDCHVYSDPGDGGRLVFIPHGMDETYGDAGREVFGVYGVAALRCLEVPSCEADLRERIRAQLEVSEEHDASGEFEAARARLRESITNDPRRLYDLPTVLSSQQTMGTFIQDREINLSRWR
jgi:hypothetical protein